MPRGEPSQSSQASLISRFGQISQLPDVFVQEGSSSDAMIKQEGQGTKKRALSRQPSAQAEYKWNEERDRATAKARRLGLTELPANEVAQVIKDDTLTAILHANWKQEQLDAFFHYEGLEVLARVVNDDMQAIVRRLAALHIGDRLYWSHPDEQDLQVSVVQMKGLNSCAYAMKVSPPEEYMVQALRVKRMREARARNN
ncbi:hypothetical protein PG985_008041 [Apiospora marii]|uniref:Uncharacterized protein n=1 Tax=Apiospora marii TaxID=335849 RepID=A0ABR1R9R3_9PEZI